MKYINIVNWWKLTLRKKKLLKAKKKKKIKKALKRESEIKWKVIGVKKMFALRVFLLSNFFVCLHVVYIGPLYEYFERVWKLLCISEYSFGRITHLLQTANIENASQNIFWIRGHVFTLNKG